MSDRFDGTKFRKVWQELSEEERERIRDKAQWEYMSLSGVMKNWWPHLWKQIAIEESET